MLEAVLVLLTLGCISMSVRITMLRRRVDELEAGYAQIKLELRDHDPLAYLSKAAPERIDVFHP